MKTTSPLIPWYITNYILAKETDFKTPFHFKEDAAVLFTDICSFTKLTEHFSATGHYGVEGITTLLTKYFSEMIACIHNNSGSLAKLGGDSILAVFPGDRIDAISRLVKCGNEMLAALKAINSELDKEYGITINFRGSGAYGEVNTCIVGDAAYHYDYYFLGEGIERALAMEPQTKPGNISYDFDLSEVVDNPAKFNFKNLPTEQIEILEKAFISENIRRRVIGQTKFKAELKNSAIIFINMEPANEQGKQQKYIDFDAYHDLYCKIQEIVYSLDGNINKIDVNDKGYMMIICFGVPNIHYDDIERAFFCCYRITQLESQQINLRSGVTFSNIFAGNFGSSGRFEYGIIGNGVNTAARLMQFAEAGQITFSKAILARISSRFDSEFIEETTVKGIKEPIQIYRLKGELPENWKALSNQYQDRQLIVKRDKLEQIVQGLIEGEIKLVRIYGEVGIGKTFFIYSILQGLWQSFSKIDIIILEEFNKLGKFDYIFKLITKKLQLTSLDKDIDKLLNYCRKNGIVVDEFILADRIATYSSGKSTRNNLAREQTGKSSSIEDQQLMNEIFFGYLQDIVVSLLANTDILVIDNYQWLDSLSEKILTTAIPTLIEKGFKMIVSYTQSAFSTEEASSDKTICDRVLTSFGSGKCESVHLERLTIEEVKSLLLAELSPKKTYINEKGKQVTKSSWTANVSDSAILLLNKISGGNPFFLVELSKIIKENFNYEQDLITDAVILHLQRSGLIPDTMESIFLREFEGLDNQARHLLMIASIVGSIFSLNDLMIIDKEQMIDDIVSILDILDKNRIIDQKDLNPEIEYIFANTLMREAIYKTILMGEKKLLHEKIAGYYEVKYADQLNNYVEIIAKHYLQTDVNEKKVFYCRKAAQKNSSLYCLDESCYYFTEAISATEDEALKIELEMDMLIIMLLQGKTTEVEKNIVQLSNRIAELEKTASYDSDTLTKLQEYLLYLKVKTKIYKADHLGVLEDIEASNRTIKNAEFRTSIESYYLDCLRFLGRYEQFLERAKSSLEKAIRDKDKWNEAIFSSLMGEYYLTISDYTNALLYFQQKLASAEEINEQIMKRQAINSIGVAYSRAGDKQKAKECFEEACALAEKLGDRNGLTRILINLGLIYKNDGDYKSAMDCYYKSLRLTKLTTNRQQEAIILYNIGESIYTSEQDYEKALTFLNRSLDIALELQDKLHITFCYDGIGDMNYYLGKIDKAEEIYTKNLAIQETIGDKEGIAHTLGNLGNVAKERKQYGKAIEIYLKQLKMLQEVGDKDGEGRSWFNMAMVDIEQGNYPEAKEKLLQALTLFESIYAKYYVDVTKERLAALDEEIKVIR